MRPFNVKLWCCIGLVAGLAILAGCGSGGDLLDEVGTRYVAYAIPQEDGSDVHEIDVVFVDCNDDPLDPDFESNFPFDVKIVVETDTTAARFSIQSYDVTFRRNHGSYWESTTAQPEDLTASEMPALTGTVLNPVSYSYSSPVILPNTARTFEGLLVWSQVDKNFYLSNVLANTNPPFGDLVGVTAGGYDIYEQDTADMVYDMQVVLHCITTENQDFTITTPWTPVHFLDIDKCS